MFDGVVALVREASLRHSYRHWEGCRGVIVPGERCVKQGRFDAVAGVVRVADASPVEQTHRGHQQEQTMKRQFATRGAFVRQLFRRIGIPTQGTKFTFLARVPRQVKQRTQFWWNNATKRTPWRGSRSVKCVRCIACFSRNKATKNQTWRGSTSVRCVVGRIAFFRRAQLPPATQHTYLRSTCGAIL